MDLEKLAKPYLKNLVPYKPGKPIEQLRREIGYDGEIAKLASNENPYPPLEPVRRAVIEELDRVQRYPESGAPDLTARLADYHQVETDEVFVANGTNEILELLLRGYVGHDENIVFSELSFAIYKLISLQCDVGHIEVPQREYTHDLVAMAEAVNDETKMVFVCNPNNPTSTYNTAPEVDALFASLPDHLLVIMDEAYYDFVNADDYPDSLARRKTHENMVILRTFSKCYSLAGIRVGYAIADPRVVRVLHSLRQPFNVNRLAQVAALAAINYREELNAFIDETISERRRMREKLLAMGCMCPPSQTNFLFVIPDEKAQRVCQRLEADGIIVRPKPGFGAPANSFRVNTGTPAENDRFLAAFKKILAG